MLNLHINILTTGISPPSSYRCVRCKLPTTYGTEADLSRHTDVVHHRVETEEEKEGKKQKARWSEVRPDPRIRDTRSNDKAEELVLLHENDVHYNISVHKSRNTFKTETHMREHTEKHIDFKT